MNQYYDFLCTALDKHTHPYLWKVINHISSPWFVSIRYEVIKVNLTTHLKSLQWLSVKVRSTYKIASLCYHCHSSTAPSYVTDMLQKKPSHTHNTRSSSYTMHLLNRPAHSNATLGFLCFFFCLEHYSK